METTGKIKDCFGDQGGMILGGDSAEECWGCEFFERCHKVTVAMSLQGIAMDLSLFTQNGLRAGWLKPFKELNQSNSTPNNS